MRDFPPRRYRVDGSYSVISTSLNVQTRALFLIKEVLEKEFGSANVLCDAEAYREVQG